MSVIWLEAVKIYGNKPKKLLIKIKTKREIKITVEPWFEEGPKSILNSKCSFFNIDTKSIENFLGINQKTGRQKIKIISDLNQLRERFKLAAGSKTENKFVIMFRRN